MHLSGKNIWFSGCVKGHSSFCPTHKPVAKLTCFFRFAPSIGLVPTTYLTGFMERLTVLWEYQEGSSRANLLIIRGLNLAQNKLCLQLIPFSPLSALHNTQTGSVLFSTQRFCFIYNFFFLHALFQSGWALLGEEKQEKIWFCPVGPPGKGDR